MLKIEKMYAFIAQEDEGEGVCGMMFGNQWMPFVGADIKRVDDLRPLAQQIATKTGKQIKICYFSERTELEVIKP